MKVPVIYSLQFVTLSGSLANTLYRGRRLGLVKTQNQLILGDRPPGKALPSKD